MTRITLDIGELLREGKIDEAEAERLKALAITSDRGSIIANLLCIFGALALSAGVVALKPDPSTGLFLALAALGVAGTVRVLAYDGWRILGDGMAICGIAGISGWLGLEYGDWLGGYSYNAIVLVFVVLGTFAFKQPFISAFIPLSIGALIGSGTAYWHASYGIFVREPSISIVVFTTLTTLLYYLLKRIEATRWADWRTIVLIPARVSFFMINFAFWVGTFWGDHPGEHFVSKGLGSYQLQQEWKQTAFFVPDWIFVIVWAAALAFAIWFGLREHNRFIANTSIVFLAIHFYTQLYEYLGAEPILLVVAGASMLAAAVWFFRFIRKQAQMEVKANPATS